MIGKFSSQHGTSTADSTIHASRALQISASRGQALYLHLDTLGIINGCIDFEIMQLAYPDMAYKNVSSSPYCRFHSEIGPTYPSD